MRRPLAAAVLLAGFVGLLALPADPVEAGAPPTPELEVTEIAGDLSIPWGLAFAPDGTLYFTERSGTWSWLPPDLSGAPNPVAFDDHDLFVRGETGLLDLAVDPNFANNGNARRRVFTCQGHQVGNQAPRIQVISWRMSADNSQAVRLRDPLVDNVTRWGQQGRHGGCRLAFDANRRLWVATGDGATRANPQALNRLGGKTLRVNRDHGRGVPGNPWENHQNANRRRVWTYGHRNIQGLAPRPGTNQMWAVEHGTYRNDEVNLLIRGRNYGWHPGPGYDESAPMTNRSRFPGAVPARWRSGNPTIAPSGGVFLEGDHWGAWEGALAMAVLKDQELRLLSFDGAGRLTGEATPPELDGTHGRLRTAVMGPDGALYLTTSNGGGNDRILRVTPVEG